MYYTIETVVSQVRFLTIHDHAHHIPVNVNENDFTEVESSGKGVVTNSVPIAMLAADPYDAKVVIGNYPFRYSDAAQASPRVPRPGSLSRL